MKTEGKKRVAREVSVTGGTNVDPKNKNNNVTQTVQKNLTDTGRIVVIGGRRKKVVHVEIVTDVEKFTENVTTILRTDGSSETRKINHHTHNNTIEHDNKFVDLIENGTAGTGNSGDSSGMNNDGSINSMSSLNGGSAAKNSGDMNGGGSINGAGTNSGGSMNGPGTNIGGSINGGGTNSGGSTSGKINEASGVGAGSTFRDPLNGLVAANGGKINGGGTGSIILSDNTNRLVAPSTRRPASRSSIAPKIQGGNLANAGFGVFGTNFGKK